MLVGTGVALSVERSGGLFECAEIHVDDDGDVLVVVGSTPTGQGHETLFAQIAADKLGVDPERVTVRTGDTDLLADGVGSFASRTTAMGGSAVAAAADDLLASGGAVGRARFESDQVFAGGAYAAVVEVDRATGAVRVRRLVAVDDAGRIMNPLLAEGQVVGGAVQGLGACLTEEAGRSRRCSTTALLTAAEVPEIATEFVESPSPLNPLGAKGIARERHDRRAARGRQRARRRARAPPRPAVHRREGLAGAPVILDTPLDEAWAALSTLAPARGTVAGYTGTAVLEEADDDTHTATLRLQGTGPNGPVTATVTATLEAGRASGTRLHFATRAHPDPPHAGDIERSRSLIAAGSRAASTRRRRAGRWVPARSPRGHALKPAPFEYVGAAQRSRRRSRCSTSDTRVLAGGQSLVPLLNLRVARPARLVDINRIAGLGVLRRTDGTLRIGATVRQAALERSALVAHRWPLLAQAVRHVGHAATRARGTVAGSAAHADPAAELPVALTGARRALRAALGGRHAHARRRRVLPRPVDDGARPGELLIEIDVPPLEARRAHRVRRARAHPRRLRHGRRGGRARPRPRRGRGARQRLASGARRRAEAALVDGASAGEAAALAAAASSDRTAARSSPS